jgi:hypothetical protein
MILPWYSKYVGYALIVLLACFYTGVKVANHYEEKLAKIEALGWIQKERVKVIETKQKEIVKNVNRSVSRDIALSDDYYSLRFSGSSEVSNPSGRPGGTTEASPPASSDTACNPKDGAADAIVILGWQDFYRQLRDAR